MIRVLLDPNSDRRYRASVVQRRRRVQPLQTGRVEQGRGLKNLLNDKLREQSHFLEAGARLVKMRPRK